MTLWNPLDLKMVNHLILTFCRHLGLYHLIAVAAAFNAFHVIPS